MKFQSKFSWPDHAAVCLDDGQINLPEYCDTPFPGYIAQPNKPFLPQHTLTHPAYDLEPGVGRFSFGDSPEAYDKNFSKMGPGWHYATKQVTYHCNSDGYRAPEWQDIDWASSIVILGCSMTFGSGLAQDETISHYVSELTGRSTVNLGFPSAGNDLLLNNAAALVNNFPCPHAVVINWSTLDRVMFYSQYPRNVGLWTQEGDHAGEICLHQVYKHRNISKLNRAMESYYLAQHARAMFQNRTRYVTLSYFAETAHYTRSDGYIKFDLDPEHERARDLIHPGPGTSLRAAKFISQRLAA